MVDQVECLPRPSLALHPARTVRRQVLLPSQQAEALTMLRLEVHTNLPKALLLAATTGMPLPIKVRAIREVALGKEKLKKCWGAIVYEAETIL